MLNVERNSIRTPVHTWLGSLMEREALMYRSDRRDDYKLPWKVSLCFNISQRDEVILALFKRHLGCGTMRRRHDGVWYYEVNNFTAIVGNVIPFFERFGFLSAKKKRDFAEI